MKIIKRITTKFVLLSLLFMMLNIPFTAAYFSDIESSPDNTFLASSLDMEFTSPESDFVGSPLEPGETATRSATLANVGALPFNYTQEYQFVAGDSDLCAALQISLDGGPFTPLSGFSSSAVTLSPSANNSYDYEVILPLEASSNLRNKTCTFNLVAKAWQVGGVYGSGFWDVEVLANNVSSGNWPPPAPSLVSPADGTVAVVGSEWMMSPVMDWTDIAWSEPVTYRYQSSYSPATNPDGSFTTPVYTSGVLPSSQIPAPGTPDGVYFWHARACDATWGCGEWSDIWQLTVDRTMQEAQPGEVVINEVMWMGADGNPDDEWLELKNTTANPIILKNWIIENGGSGGSSITLSGTIPANGFFLISHFASSASAINDLITVDNVIPGLSLLNGGEQLTLKDAAGNIIDQTPSGSWPAGEHSPPIERSMERNDTPGDGTQAASWHTCTSDACNDTTYWDAEGNNYGTPKAANLSSNDPTTSSPLVLSPEATASSSAQPDPVTTPSATIPTPPMPEPIIEPTITLEPEPPEPEPERDEDEEEIANEKTEIIN